MLLIARRYLFSSKSHSVVNIICCVSVVSLLMPVAAVIILLSIFNGFTAMIGDTNGALESNLTIESRSAHLFDRAEIDGLQSLENSGIEAISFVSEQLVLLRNGENNSVVTLRGVDSVYTDVVDIKDHVIAGEFSASDQGDGAIVVGGEIAMQLNVRSLNSSTLEIVSLNSGALQSMLSLWQYNTLPASVGGVVAIDIESDGKYIYAPQWMVDEIANGAGKASRAMVRVAKGANLEATQRRIAEVIGDGFAVKSRAQMDETTYNIVRYEKLGVALICGLVMLMASFSLLGALAMLIIEKRGDIKVLRAMGASIGNIKRIFLLEGGIISVGAIAIGTAIGCGVTLAQQHIGIVELPSQSMVVNYYPVQLLASDLIAVVGVSAAIAGAISWVVVNRMINER